jgi:hypothetical protein
MTKDESDVAPPPEERRDDSVAIPRSTVKVVTSVISSLLLGVGIVLFDISIEHARIAEQLKQLTEFGPNTGERFTKQDGRELKEEIDQLRDWLLENQKAYNRHSALGEHPFAGRRLDHLESWVSEHDH